MNNSSYPTLKGTSLFREGELVYLNKSNELQEYCNIIHKHDFIEIAYVYSGEGIHIVGEEQYAIAKGDLFIINHDTPHGFFPKNSGNEAPLVYNCTFMPQFLDASLFSQIHFEDITTSFLFKSLFPEEFTPHPDLRLVGTEFNEIGDLFSKMYTEYQLAQKGYCDMIRAYLIELIIKIFRYINPYNHPSPSLKNKALVDMAVSYLKSHYTSEIRLEDLAMKSFISKNYFSKLFKEVTGINFVDYIQKVRIGEACSLLRNTDMKVIDVALETGFKDIKFFYEVFKKITGKTPGSYRNQK